MQVEFKSSVLFVRDIETSRQFYQDLLGQAVSVDHGPNVEFAGGFAMWQVDHAYRTIFGRPADGAERLGRRNVELYFEPDDLDAAWKRLSDAGVPVVHAICEQPWGQRVFRVYDPDGHIVELGEPMRVVVLRYLDAGMSEEAVARRTSMPLEVVRQIARGRGPTRS